jgi:hypothetical protein
LPNNQRHRLPTGIGNAGMRSSSACDDDFSVTPSSDGDNHIDGANHGWATPEWRSPRHDAHGHAIFLVHAGHPAQFGASIKVGLGYAGFEVVR